MEFNYSYQKDSLVDNSTKKTDVSFAPDTRRDPTYFKGQLRENIAFREGISALHDVVVSDLRWKPKDREAYKAWLAKQEQIDWEHVAAQQKDVAQQIQETRAELDALRSTRQSRMAPYYAARQKYFDYIYTRDKDMWYVLDPVITVHPDELFFECFSRDESSYGRLGVGYDVFKNVGEFSCGTTNIDYSSALYDEFQKIRTYKTTSFEIDPGGFDIQTTGDESYKEVKIDLPDSWVRGFLQVSSAMALPAATLTLDPMDVHNICLILRRKREIKGPRSLRYQLTPGQPIKIVFDPWGIELECPRSIYHGEDAQEIRVWGRRRMHILERLIPVAKSFTVQLLGKGMPSFYIADLGDMTFTLGLSGWTANDWSSAGNFDLLAPRAEVDTNTKLRVFEALQENWYESPDSLAKRLSLDRADVLGALSAWTQAGRAIWDGHRGVYRVRELTQEPLPMDKLMFSNPREAKAMEYLSGKATKVTSSFMDGGLTVVQGRVLSEGTKARKKHRFEPTIKMDADERIRSAECTCNWHQQNQLRKGPCEHILALRMQFSRSASSSGLLSLFGKRS